MKSFAWFMLVICCGFARAQDASPPDSIPVQPVKAEQSDAPSPPARDDAAVQLETITVTAGKRAQDIRAVPGSVAALRGEDLEARGAQGMEDYLKLVPGVTFSKGGVDGGVPVIRGIATGTGIAQTPVPVGIYLDEIPFGDLFLPTSVTDANPFDLERVEVLKGPQGTLFGSGSLAGAIRYITNKPELNVWQARLMGVYSDVSQGSFGSGGAGMFNIPLGDTAAFRLTGLYRDTPGVTDEPNRGMTDVDPIRQYNVRGQAQWLPLEDLKLNLLYLKQRTRQANDNFSDQTERIERNDTPQPTPRDSRFDAANLTANYAFDWGSLLSSTSRKGKDIYNQSDISRGQQQGGAAGSIIDPIIISETAAPLVLPLYANITGFNQELRLASPEDAGAWHWLAGASYQRDREHILNISPTPLLDQAAPVDGLPIFPTPETPIGGVSGTRDAQLQYILIDARATEKALFAEVTRALGQRWELTAGARLFQTRLVADTFFSGAELSAISGRTETRGRSVIDEHGVNPKFSVKYQLSRNLSTYVLAAKGFQFGGVQILPATLVTTSVAQQGSEAGFVPYKSSKLWNYEWGVRSDWFARRLQVDATLFHLSWKDLQLTQQDANRVFSFVGNVGHAHSDGAELALTATIAPGLRWQSSAAFVNAVSDVFYAAPGGDVPAGTQLPGSAKFTSANVLSYDLPVALLGISPGASLTHTHTGKVFSDLQHSREIPAYDLLDVSLRLVGSAWRLAPDLSLGVTNLLDARAISSISDHRTVDDVVFVRPRTYAAMFTVRFQ